MIVGVVGLFFSSLGLGCSGDPGGASPVSEPAEAATATISFAGMSIESHAFSNGEVRAVLFDGARTEVATLSVHADGIGTVERHLGSKIASVRIEGFDTLGATTRLHQTGAALRRAWETAAPPAHRPGTGVAPRSEGWNDTYDCYGTPQCSSSEGVKTCITDCLS